MMEKIDPLGTPKLTSSAAVSPPKLMDRLSTVKNSFSVCLATASINGL
jgi:hypothetical protein